MQHGGDAEDVVPADVGHRRLDDALTVLQAAITLEGFPGAVPALWPPGAAEEVQVLTVRHQHDLRTDARVSPDQQEVLLGSSTKALNALGGEPPTAVSAARAPLGRVPAELRVLTESMRVYGDWTSLRAE